MKKRYHSKEYLREQVKTKDYLQIAREHDVDPSTIHKWLRKHDLTGQYDYWTQEEIELLKRSYCFRENVHELFPERSPSSVYHKASRLKLKREVKPKTYMVNESFFKQWTPHMAYVFGWFCSDGHVSVKKHKSSIHLQEKDRSILEKIRKTMQSNHPIVHYGKSVALRFHSKVIHADLIRLGCFPRKSAILPFPNVPDTFLSHFVRGYFDGDGSIHFNKPNTIKVSFTGSKTFVNVLQYKMERILGLKKMKLRQVLKIWQCHYYGDGARKLCHWMYRDCGNLFLQRKRERFNNHLKKREKHGL